MPNQGPQPPSDRLRVRLAAGVGVELAVRAVGQGPAVVLMHGLAGFRELWEDLLPPLAAAGFLAIAFDHRGHGMSSDVAPPWTIADLADDLLALLDQLAIQQACLLGHSMGGRVLFQFALAHPERLWALVPVGAHSEAPRGPYRQVLADVRTLTLRDGLPGFRGAFERAGEIPERVRHDPSFAAAYDAWFARNRAPMLVAALDAILAMPTLTPRLAEIAVPALAVVGERDGPFRELAAYYEQAIPRCRTVVVADCHHYPMTDQPAAFAEALLPFLQASRPDV